MIRNIVFDIGNVLLDFKPLEYLNSAYAGEPWIGNAYRAIFKGPEWLEMDRGTIGEEQAIDSICRRHPDPETPSAGLWGRGMTSWRLWMEPYVS